VTPSTSVALLRAAAVRDRALVTTSAISAVSTWRAAPRPAVTARGRPRGLPRRATHLPLAVGRGDFFRGPRAVEQILELVQGRRAHGAALAAVNGEAKRSIERRQLALAQISRQLLR
jgi:hypothetical protein